MADVNRILGVLCGAKAPLTVSVIMAQTGVKAVSPSNRGSVLRSLALLMQRKLVSQERRRAKVIGIGELEALYSATKAGFEFHRAGNKFTRGPRGPQGYHREARPYPANAFYQRLWTALRIAQGRRGSLPELIEMARLPSDPAGNGIASSARSYIIKLISAGIVTRLQQRDKSGGGGGFTRFAMLRDLGPLAPVTRKPHVFDPNSRTIIPYAEKQP